jgi:hypothetical protein
MATELEQHGYMVIKPATIALSPEMLEGARGLIERLREIGEAATTAIHRDLVELSRKPLCFTRHSAICWSGYWWTPAWSSRSSPARDREPVMGKQ